MIVDLQCRFCTVKLVTVHLGLRRWSPSLAGQLELPLPVTITVTPSLRPATGTESDKMIPKEYDLQIYKKFRVTVIVSDYCQCQGRRLTAFESGSAQGSAGPRAASGLSPGP